MFVNGYPVKLRGACRHDMHPTLGRTTTAELDSLDAILFKEANMNFVRTSHYPPTERFLDYCDRYGIYVECETAVCFQNKSEDLPQYANQYVSQVKEMVKSFRTHPSIIIWSIGNESKYGENFYKSWEWVKATDTTRPVIFSWPGHQRDDKTKVYDIVSIHYPSTGGSLKQKGIPVKNFEAEENKPTLFDEWAHPACYTYETLQNDPNIREFWGQSIDMMWSNLFNVHGGLGGAIWCYVDETFMLPEPKTGTAFWRDIKYDDKPKENIGKCVGYGEWGIVDVWRRKKPEFWATKKAYSPIRLSIEKNISDFASGKNILIQVHNRFNHTDLKDIQGIYTYRGKKYKLQLPSIPPHKQGKIMLPSQSWATGEKIKIEFYTKDGNLIDIYQPVLGEEKIKLPEPAFTNKGITVEEDTEFLTICGKEFKIPFSKKSGLIVNAMVKGKTVIEKGPFLHHRNYQKNKKSCPKTIPFNISENDWIKTSLLYQKHDDKVIVELSGKYKDVTVDYQITVMSDGRIFISYHATGIPNELLYESGIALHLPNDLSRLTWKRNGHWGYYDDSSFAGNEGSTSLYNSNLIAYGQQPKQPWSMDTHNYFYWADTGSNCKKPLTRAAKGMKENIYYYTLFAKSKENSSLSVFSSDASIGCRLSKRSDEQLVLYINNRWDYPDIAWGNYCKRIKALPCKGEITLQLR